MHRERLMKLLDVLDMVPDGDIDMELWETKCGTAACAVGWACRDAWFQEQGLRMVRRVPMYKDEKNWAAVEAFFGLTPEEAEDLFLMPKNKEEVISAIRGMLGEGRDT